MDRERRAGIGKQRRGWGVMEATRSVLTSFTGWLGGKAEYTCDLLNTCGEMSLIYVNSPWLILNHAAV